MTKTRKEEAGLRKPSSHDRGMSRDEFEDKYDPDEEIKFLRDKLKKAAVERETYEKEHGSLKSLFRELRDLVPAIQPPKISYKAPKASKVAHPIVHVSHWSDWHDGAVQEPDEVEGFRTFNPQVLRTELNNCETDQQQWCDLHRSNYVVNERRNIVTGDLISGGIHPELLWTNQYPVPVQAIKAGELLATLIARQAPHYQKVVVDFVTADNHGRLTKKPQCNEAGLNCWGYVTGCFAQERLRDFANVEFNLYPVIQTVIEVASRRYLICHGDQVRGWAGFPYYGIERKMGREAVKRMKRGQSKFDRMVCGHWHAPLTHPWYWIGGSASGTTTYDHREGRESEPCQCAWFVHEKHGEFDRTDWNLHGD